MTIAGLDLPEDVLKSLIAHAYTRKLQVERQLSQQRGQGEDHISVAICEQGKLDLKEANERVLIELDRQQDRLLLDKEAEVS